jgi:hypothetical protein
MTNIKSMEALHRNRVIVHECGVVGTVVEKGRVPGVSSCVLVWARSGCARGSMSRMESVSGVSVMAPVSNPEAPAASECMYISMVTDKGVGIVSGMNRGGAVTTSALISEVLKKNEGEKPVPKMSPIGIQSMCSTTVLNAGAMSRWNRMRLNDINIIFVQQYVSIGVPLVYTLAVDQVVKQGFAVVDRRVALVVYARFWCVSVGVARIAFEDCICRIDYNSELLLLQD